MNALIRRPFPISESGQRRGFTLIETIIAMSLLSLLMAIVWTMFSVYTKLEAKGVTVAQESRLVRAIDRQLRRDSLHVVAIDKQRSVSLDQGNDPAEIGFPQNGYLVGTATELHFVVCTEPESTDIEDPIRVISYQPRLVVVDSEDPLEITNDADFASTSDDEREPKTTDEYETPWGIDRHDRSWRQYWKRRATSDSLEETLSTGRPIALEAEDFIQIGSRTSQDGAHQQRVLQGKDQTDPIPELRRLRFRYYDGQVWVSQWDSSIQRRLPWAIEMNFDLQPREDPSSDETVKPALERQGDQSLAADRLDSNENTITIGPNNSIDDLFVTDYRIVVLVPAASKHRPTDWQLNRPVAQEEF